MINYFLFEISRIYDTPRLQKVTPPIKKFYHKIRYSFH